MRGKISVEELQKLSYNERFDLLSDIEKYYFMLMSSTVDDGGCLMLYGRPGDAKSSMARNIAYIMGYNYIHNSLSTSDETDFGLPKLVEVEVDGKSIDAHTITTPLWAIEANQFPTIIHFEELNRCSDGVRDACLGVLLERVIGHNFKFNKKVLFIASGNLGEDDGTDVKDFDNALNNRLIHVKHKLEVSDWINNFAKYNVHPLIVDFIKTNPEYLWRKEGSNNGVSEPTFATPRSWTMFSNVIMKYYCGDDENRFIEILEGNYDVAKLKNDKIIQRAGSSIVGASVAKFYKHLENVISLNINDILNNFPKFKERFEDGTFNRDRKSEIINKLIYYNLDKITAVQYKNLIGFLEICDEDEVIGFMTNILDTIYKQGVDVKEPYKSILKNMKHIVAKIDAMG